MEVQAHADANFAGRLFDYFARIRDRFRRLVLSAEILADDNPNWMPRRYTESCLRCRLGFDFPVVKVLKFARRRQWLERSANPVAVVVAAHLASQRTHRDPAAWKELK